MGKKIKNKDIAARLGFSGTLVSLVLNNKADQHGIKKETQERVFAVARQMGYYNQSKDKVETPVTEEKPGVVGMIVPSMNDPFVYEITPYLEKAFSSIGLGFSVFTRDPDDLRFGRFISSLKKFFTGMILVGDAADDNTVRALNREDYPLVLIEKNLKRLRMNTVCSDSAAGAAMMSEHLASLGYKRLLIISGDNPGNAEKLILEEFRASIKKSRNFDDVQMAAVNPPRAGESLEFSTLEDYLRPPFRTDAVVVTDPLMVFPLMSSLQEQHVRVPMDVALVCLQDGIGFDLLQTSVTRLKRPVSNMALKTANTLWSEIKNKGKSKYKRQVNLAPDLIVKSSCGSYVK